MKQNTVITTNFPMFSSFAHLRAVFTVGPLVTPLDASVLLFLSNPQLRLLDKITNTLHVRKH